MSESNRGGIRPGAGRKPSGKSRLQLWVTAEEKELLNRTLAEMRSGKLKKVKCPKACEGKLYVERTKWGQTVARCDTCNYSANVYL